VAERALMDCLGKSGLRTTPNRRMRPEDRRSRFAPDRSQSRNQEAMKRLQFAGPTIAIALVVIAKSKRSALAASKGRRESLRGRQQGNVRDAKAHLISSATLASRRQLASGTSTACRSSRLEVSDGLIVILVGIQDRFRVVLGSVTLRKIEQERLQTGRIGGTIEISFEEIVN
jgi:hypothetical protein